MVRVNLFPDVKGLCKRTDSEAELCVSSIVHGVLVHIQLLPMATSSAHLDLMEKRKRAAGSVWETE